MSADRVAAKWRERASGATTAYEDGVKTTQKDWQGATKAAAPAWQAGVQEAIAKGRFASGVNRVSTAEWRDSTVKNSGRFGQGVTNAEADYAAEIAPVLGHIEAGLRTLRPRGPRRSGENKARMDAMFDHMGKYQRPA